VTTRRSPTGAAGTAVPAESLAAYQRLVATIPGLERKGATMPYTSVNGHMFSYLDSSGVLALRLGDADRAAFMERYNARLQVAHGVTQKEYVAVPVDLLEQTAELGPWFAASHAHVSGLRPKATTR
jgi:hypothetical protein